MVGRGRVQRGRIVRIGIVAFVVSSLGACGGAEDRVPAPAAPSDEEPASVPASEDDTPLIAYQTVQGGEEQIWLIGVDGDNARQLPTGEVEQALLPDWSNDGTRLVFASRGGSSEPLYIYDTERQSAEQLFECVGDCLGDDEPSFSPDDAQVAFIRAVGPIVDDKPSECGLWIGDVATREVRQLTAHAGCDPRETSPRWSPDGSQLTYWTERYDEAGELTGTAVFVIGADGQGARQLTDWNDNAGEADWSPDGDWIVYATHPLHDFGCCEVSNLHRIHPDGTGAEALTDYTDAQVRATQPRYTPDGAQILFTLVTSDRDLALVPADGGEVTAITNGGIHTHGDMRSAPPG